MVKKDFVNKVAKKTGLTVSKANEIVNAAFDIIHEELLNGEEVPIAGVGKFQVKDVEDRRARNPRTGEMMTVPAHRVLRFKVSSTFRAAVR